MFQAFEKKITANTAIMYCDHKLCNFCKQSLANLLCLVGVTTLTWIGPNDKGPGYATYTFRT